MSMSKVVFAGAVTTTLAVALLARAERVFGLGAQAHFIPASQFEPDDSECRLAYYSNYTYKTVQNTGASGYCGWFEAPPVCRKARASPATTFTFSTTTRPRACRWASTTCSRTIRAAPAPRTPRWPIPA